ncbi:MAG: hypothetical protein CMF69_00230 [Magnetovibrio sp.]|nr:hypothetical protein [Magnetovibrio sp.]
MGEFQKYIDRLKEKQEELKIDEVKSEEKNATQDAMKHSQNANNHSEQAHKHNQAALASAARAEEMHDQASLMKDYENAALESRDRAYQNAQNAAIGDPVTHDFGIAPTSDSFNDTINLVHSVNGQSSNAEPTPEQKANAQQAISNYEGIIEGPPPPAGQPTNNAAEQTPKDTVNGAFAPVEGALDVVGNDHPSFGQTAQKTYDPAVMGAGTPAQQASAWQAEGEKYDTAWKNAKDNHALMQLEQEARAEDVKQQAAHQKTQHKGFMKETTNANSAYALANTYANEAYHLQDKHDILQDEIDRAEKKKKQFSSLRKKFGGSDYAELTSIQTVSISINDAKAPVRSLGFRDIKGMTRSQRTIAGTMIFIVVDDHPLAELMALDPQQVIAGFKDVRKLKWHVDQQRGRGKNDQYRSGRSHVRVATDLAPFNVMMEYASEYPGAHWAMNAKILKGRAHIINNLRRMLKSLDDELKGFGLDNSEIAICAIHPENSKAANILGRFEKNKKILTEYQAKIGGQPFNEKDGKNAGKAIVNRVKSVLERRNAVIAEIEAQEDVPLGWKPEQGGAAGQKLVNNCSLLLEGVEFLHEGVVTSVNDMVSEVTFQFIAQDFYELSLEHNNPYELFPDIQDVLAEFAWAKEVNLGGLNKSAKDIWDGGDNTYDYVEEQNKLQLNNGLKNGRISNPSIPNPIKGVTGVVWDVAPDDDMYMGGTTGTVLDGHRGVKGSPNPWVTPATDPNNYHLDKPGNKNDK